MELGQGCGGEEVGERRHEEERGPGTAGSVPRSVYAENENRARRKALRMEQDWLRREGGVGGCGDPGARKGGGVGREKAELKVGDGREGEERIRNGLRR